MKTLPDGVREKVSYLWHFVATYLQVKSEMRQSSKNSEHS